MRIHYLQHVPFEGLGSMEPWLKDRNHDVSCTRVYESHDLPDPSQFEVLIVMGGPMSVNDHLDYPWLDDEKRFIRAAIEANKRVLGICLGAQLIASSMGAAVSPNAFPEIGWFPVTGIPDPAGAAFQFPATLDVFHWHSDTFDLPVGAKRLAQSEGCTNQAFQIGKTVLGLQFHLETTAESAAQIVANCGDELQPARYVHSAEAILSAPASRYEAVNAVMGDVLSYLLSQQA